MSVASPLPELAPSQLRSPHPARLLNRHYVWLPLFCAIFAPTVYWLWQRWTLSVWHNIHGLFIPVIVGFLIRDALRRDESAADESSAWGFMFLAPALLLVVVDAPIRTQLLSAVGLVVSLPGLSLLLLGKRRTRRIVFPLVMALFMLPVPAAFVEPLQLLLRILSAAGSGALVRLSGIVVFREHTTLWLADAGVEIGDACSGFSTLYAAVALAVYLAYKSPVAKRRIAVLLAAIPCAVLCNVLRCYLLVVLVQLAGAPILDTPLHAGSGVFSFAGAVLVLLAIAGGNNRLESRL